MTRCPDCARARLFSAVNGGSWCRRNFGRCWSCFRRNEDRLCIVGGVALVLASLVGNVLAWLWAGRRWLP